MMFDRYIHAKYLGVATALCFAAIAIVWILWSYSPLVATPFLVQCYGKSNALSAGVFIVQLVGGALFFIYGVAAWMIPLLLLGGLKVLWMPRSFACFFRVLGLIAVLPFLSAVATAYHVVMEPFVPGGVLGKACLGLMHVVIAQRYRYSIGILMGCLIALAVFQESIVQLFRRVNIMHGVRVLGKIVVSWIFYLFPFMKFFIKKSQEKDAIQSIIDQSLAEDYHALAKQYARDRHEDGACSLARIFYDRTLTYTQVTYQYNIDQEHALMHTLHAFGIQATCTKVCAGPRLTTFLLQLAPGVKITSVLAREDDIACALGVQHVRIQAPAPGTCSIGIEIDNEKRCTVSLGALLQSPAFNTTSCALPLLLGTDTSGIPLIVDLAEMPHLLIAGTTGSGKSVMLHSIIISVLWHFAPDALKLILIDPKRIECSSYIDIPHLLGPVLYTGEEIIAALDTCIVEMQKRYSIFAEHGVRSIRELHDRDACYKKEYPYYVIVIDEYADVHLSTSGRCEKSIVCLCQMARAAGIHVVLATQRPSVDIISGIVKANIPVRIACRVATKIDSKVIIDTHGAEKLLGKGDALMLDSLGMLRRFHGAYISVKEIERYLDAISSQHTHAHVTLDKDTFLSSPSL